MYVHVYIYVPPNAASFSHRTQHWNRATEDQMDTILQVQHVRLILSLVRMYLQTQQVSLIIRKTGIVQRRNRMDTVQRVCSVLSLVGQGT
jgi:hypothetical protein